MNSTSLSLSPLSLLATLHVSAHYHLLAGRTIAPASTLVHNKKSVIRSASRDYMEVFYLTKI